MRSAWTPWARIDSHRALILTGKGGADGAQAPATRERAVVVRTAPAAAKDERHHPAAVLAELQLVELHGAPPLVDSAGASGGS